ncbi:MAG: biotin--[acetyl-CoA-carboxylase] ligase [Solobacterium sp.]|nr:biotin--[acetyl-CoA-carboxylase] ligase [Solobacterium sp.]
MKQTDILLKYFTVNMNRSLPADLIADECGIDRERIPVCMEELRERGYEILKNKDGYCFTDANDRISEELIRLFVPDPGLPVYTFETIGSTNDYAKELVRKGAPNGTIVIADSQTAGKGRKGKSFYSPAKTGLYLSMIVRPAGNPIDVTPAQLFRITPASLIAAYEACALLSGIHCRFKRMNDMYIKDRKCAGFLSETVSLNRYCDVVVEGIGINWRTMGFPDELKNIACSFSCDTVCRAALAGVLWKKLLENTADLTRPWVVELNREHSPVLGKEIFYFRNGVRYTGIAKTINEHGDLVIEKPDGTADVLQSGEISVRFQEI